MTLQEQILRKIRTQHMRPTPRSYFRARDYAIWVLLGISFSALSVGFGMIIFMVHGTDLSLFSKLGLSFSERLLYSIPIFWILATILVAAIAYFNLKRTRKGYRISTRQFAIGASAIAVAFGTLIYVLNISKYVDRAAAANIPLYSTVVPFNTNTWFDPEHGLLSGAVKIKTSDGNFTLRDENFDLWTVSGDNVALVPAGFAFQSGDHIKIIGKKIGDLRFQAIEIRPFETEIKKGATTTSLQ